MEVNGVVSNFGKEFFFKVWDFVIYLQLIVNYYDPALPTLPALRAVLLHK